MKPSISRFPVPDLEQMPDDVRERILAVQEKSGFIPNVFLTLAHRPDEFRAFFDYHDIASIAWSRMERSCVSARAIPCWLIR
jgi:hypothetical protein